MEITFCIMFTNYTSVKTIIYWMFVQISSSPELLEVQKHEWYHVVTNCLSHVLSPSGLPKVAKIVKEIAKGDFTTFWHYDSVAIKG